MNPIPTLSPEIRDIFVRWSAVGKAVAASLKENTLRTKMLEASDTLCALGHHGGEKCAGEDVTAILLDPTATYSGIVFLVDILGQLPATAMFHYDLADAAKVRAWVRSQRLHHGDLEYEDDVDAEPGAGLEMA